MKILRQYHNDKQRVFEVTGEFDRFAPSRFLSIFGHEFETHDRDEVVLDMAHAKTVDSTFIGALFLLAEKAKKNCADLQVTNISPEVKKILDLGDLSYLIRFQ